jgi:hypothetical protein
MSSAIDCTAMEKKLEKGDRSRAVTRRPPIFLYTMVARTGSYTTYGVLRFGICPSFKDHSLSRRAKPIRVTIRNFSASLYLGLLVRRAALGLALGSRPRRLEPVVSSPG